MDTSHGYLSLPMQLFSQNMKKTCRARWVHKFAAYIALPGVLDVSIFLSRIGPQNSQIIKKSGLQSTI